MELAFLWIGVAIVTALAASSRGRSGFGWFLLGALFGPLALVAVLVMARVTQPVVAAAAAFSAAPTAGAPAAPAATKACVACFFEIDARATVCGHCRSPQPVKDPKDDSAGW